MLYLDCFPAHPGTLISCKWCLFLSATALRYLTRSVQNAKHLHLKLVQVEKQLPFDKGDYIFYNLVPSCKTPCSIEPQTFNGTWSAFAFFFPTGSCLFSFWCMDNGGGTLLGGNDAAKISLLLDQIVANIYSWLIIYCWGYHKYPFNKFRYVSHLEKEGSQTTVVFPQLPVVGMVFNCIASVLTQGQIWETCDVSFSSLKLHPWCSQ